MGRPTRPKKNRKNEEPAASDVIGFTLIRLGRRIRGEPKKAARSRPGTRKIIPRATAAIRLLRLVCANCGTTWGGDVVRLVDGRATCGDCGDNAWYVDYGPGACAVV